MRYSLLTIFLTLAVCSLTACSDGVTTFDDRDPYDEFIAVAHTPDWSLIQIAGTYRAADLWTDEFSTGAHWFDNDSLRQYQGDRMHGSWPIEIRGRGDEIWFQTTGGKHRYRGTLDGDFIRGAMIVEGKNGRMGPLQKYNFRRVR